jgi:hypothetical protein
MSAQVDSDCASAAAPESVSLIFQTDSTSNRLCVCVCVCVRADLYVCVVEVREREPLANTVTTEEGG